MRSTITNTVTGMVRTVSLLAIILTSSIAQAGFVDADWLAEGDKKILLHENTGLQWLKLANTRGQSINSVVAGMSTNYANWRLPTNDEITAVMQSMWSPVGGTDLQYHLRTNRANGDARGMLQFTRTFGTGSTAAATHHGLYTDEDGIVRRFGGYINGADTRYVISYALENQSTYSESSVLTKLGGVFLVSDGNAEYTPSDGNGTGGGDQPVNNVMAPFAGGVLLLMLGISGLAGRKESTCVNPR
jgi:hypothetical protein